MSVELVPAPKAKEVKVKYEEINSRTASHLIPEIFRLFEQTSRKYPNYKNESRDNIMMSVYHFCQALNSCGVLLRVGKKAVGILLGNVVHRPMGAPKRYGFMWTFYCDPSVTEEQKKEMWAEWHKALRERDVAHWEMDAEGEPTIPYKILYQRLGGSTEA